MTRWARSGFANKKKPLDATSWNDMAVLGQSSGKSNSNVKVTKTTDPKTNTTTGIVSLRKNYGTF